jgi:molecular chaperone HtpG
MDPQQGEKEAFFLSKRTFVVNTNNTLINSIQKLDQKNSQLAKDLIKEVYELALLSQREMGADALHEFIMRSNRVLEALTQEVLK